MISNMLIRGNRKGDLNCQNKIHIVEKSRNKFK